MAHTRDAATAMIAMQNGGGAGGGGAAPGNTGIVPPSMPAQTRPAQSAMNTGGVPLPQVPGANPELTRRLMAAMAGQQDARDRAERAASMGGQFGPDMYQ